MAGREKCWRHRYFCCSLSLTFFPGIGDDISGALAHDLGDVEGAVGLIGHRDGAVHCLGLHLLHQGTQRVWLSHQGGPGGDPMWFSARARGQRIAVRYIPFPVSFYKGPSGLSRSYATLKFNLDNFIKADIRYIIYILLY